MPVKEPSHNSSVLSTILTILGSSVLGIVISVYSGVVDWVDCEIYEDRRLFSVSPVYYTSDGWCSQDVVVVNSYCKDTEPLVVCVTFRNEPTLDATIGAASSNSDLRVVIDPNNQWTYTKDGTSVRVEPRHKKGKPVLPPFLAARFTVSVNDKNHVPGKENFVLIDSNTGSKMFPSSHASLDEISTNIRGSARYVHYIVRLGIVVVFVAIGMTVLAIYYGRSASKLRSQSPEALVRALQKEEDSAQQEEQKSFTMSLEEFASMLRLCGVKTGVSSVMKKDKPAPKKKRNRRR